MVSATVSKTPLASAQREQLTFAVLGWIAACVLIAHHAYSMGAPVRAAALAAAIGIAPTLPALSAIGHTAEAWTRTVVPSAWIAAAAAACALSGGGHSPVAATLLIGPAFALRLHGSRVAAEAALLALLAFAVAALLTAFHAPPTYPPVAPGLWLAASIALVGWLIAGGPRTEESTPAAAYETSPRSVEEPPVAPGLDPAAERIAHAAHELRTPLNHIIGFSDMIKNEVFGPIDNRYQEYAGIVVESAQRMLGTVNAYLDASKAAATGYEIQKVSLDFAPLADSAAEAARILARDKSQTVRLVLDERPLQVQADPRALRQILDNLLANAVKFGPCESIIELKIRRRGAKLVIEVEDEGPGMSEAERRGLGRAFVQGAAAEGQQGTGLGLMLVRQLVEAHGGTLDLLNAPGGGALVRVVAPVLEA